MSCPLVVGDSFSQSCLDVLHRFADGKLVGEASDRWRFNLVDIGRSKSRQPFVDCTAAPFGFPRLGGNAAAGAGILAAAACYGHPLRQS